MNIVSTVSQREIEEGEIVLPSDIIVHEIIYLKYAVARKVRTAPWDGIKSYALTYGYCGKKLCSRFLVAKHAD